MMKLTSDFDKFIEYFAFLSDISNDHGISDNNELLWKLSAYKKQAKELIAKEVINSNSVSKVDVCIIGDFSSGKSSFINSIIQKPLCPVDTNATTSSITKFVYADKVKILNEDKEISIQDYENLVRHGSRQKDTKSYMLEYQYPFNELKDIALYDTPGFSNPRNENDEKISIQQAQNSDVILLVIDIQNGDISSSLKQKIEFIRNKAPNLIWYAVINKADIKAPSARQNVLQKIKEYKFIKECFLYSSDMEYKEEFKGVRENMLELLSQISLSKDIILKNQFQHIKDKFIKDIQKLLNDIRSMLLELIGYTCTFKLDDFASIKKTYDQCIDKFVNELQEEYRENSNQKFFSSEYNHDLYLVSKTPDLLYQILIDLIFEEFFNQLEKENSSVDAYLTDKLGEKFAEEVARQFYEFSSYIHNEVTRDFQIFINTDGISVSEKYSAKVERKKDLKNLLKKEGFEDFCDYAKRGVENFSNQFAEIIDFDKQHYQKTVEKIDKFLKMLKKDKK